jgi:hypothetical protein
MSTRNATIKRLLQEPPLNPSQMLRLIEVMLKMGFSPSDMTEADFLDFYAEFVEMPTRCANDVAYLHNHLNTALATLRALDGHGIAKFGRLTGVLQELQAMTASLATKGATT